MLEFLFNKDAAAESNIGVFLYFKILKNTYVEEIWMAASNYGNLDNFFEKIYFVEESAILSSVSYSTLYSQVSYSRCPTLYSCMFYCECPTSYKCALLHVHTIWSLTLYKNPTPVGAPSKISDF